MILVYFIPDILLALGITRAQLTALAVVSKNDYNKNIWSLGPATNFSIIKAINSLDPTEVVYGYLVDTRVISKNKDKKEFEDSIRVFIHKRQTKLDRDDSTSDAQILYEQLRIRFKDLCTRHNELKRVRMQELHSRATSDEIVRLRVPRSWNRYRTVESPRQISKASGTLSQQLPSNPQEPTSTSSDLEDQGHPALPRTRIPRHSQRYSFKRYQGSVSHEPPAKAKQLMWKAPKEMSESNSKPSTTGATDSKDKQKSDKAPSTAGLRASKKTIKQSLIRSLGWHHPTVSLEAGTLEANTKRVLSNSPDLQQEVAKCLKKGSQLAVDTKRKAQRLIGRFLEMLRIRIENAVAEARRKKNGQALSESDRLKARREAVSDGERVVLDYLCERVKPKDVGDGGLNDGQKDADQPDLDEKADKCAQFLESFLTYLYSDNLPNKNSLIGKAVDKFIGILVDLELFDVSRNRSEIKVTMPFTPSSLVRSVAGQLSTELKKLYRNGTHLLYDKVSTMKDKGKIEAYIDITIQGNISAAENYIALNEMIPNRWRIAPITSSKQGFVTFSERDMTLFFWKHDSLKQKLINLALLDQDDPTTVTSTNDLETWIGGKEPGFIIKHFVCDIDPTGLSNRQKRKTGHRGAINLRSLSEIGDHLQFVEHTKPKDYHQKGYIPQGSIRTDGFRIQILAFKLRERQDARFKRLPEDDLPPRLTTTVAGSDGYLTEIRNVITSKDDIDKLWPGKNVDDMKIMTLDGGQACVVGGFAYLPKDLNDEGKGKDKATGGSCMEGIAMTCQETTAELMTDPSPAPDLVSTTVHDPVTDPRGDSSKPPFYNLAVKQKAVYQPVFRHRRWLENEKTVIPEGEEESVADIESRLPPLRGQSASIINYVEELEQVETRLKSFYAGDDNRFRKHSWDMERAKFAEYQALAERLLNVVGGSLGRRIEENEDKDPILIGVGLGQFSSNTKLSSLHSTFLSYFVKTVRSLGYVVVGINEYYTSKKCPRCTAFIAQVTLRRFYCYECKRYYHRDVLAAQNMCEVVLHRLKNFERPKHLQPRAADGTYPWMASPSTSSSNTAASGTTSASSTTLASSTTAASSSSSFSRAPSHRKRAFTVSSQDQGWRGKSARA
ncbi:hypothetical protein BGZ88_009765 [Linnemannia elongata]|nr:hypothetical protein BGZ88_009765 [Linnemannia elongata]